MNKLIPYLYRREQQKDDEKEEERHFIKGLEGMQSNIKEASRRLVRQDRLLNRIVAVFTVIAALAAVAALVLR